MFVKDKLGLEKTKEYSKEISLILTLTSIQIAKLAKIEGLSHPKKELSPWRYV